jgi:hypothetical protein
MRTNAFQIRSRAAVLRVVTGGLLASLLVVASGCQAVAAMVLLFGNEPTKKVPAEYKYLEGQKVCIVVRADMETMFEYPQVQWEISDHVRVALENNVKGAKVVEPRTVVDYQRRNSNWEKLDSADLGKQFSADRVLMIDVTQYSTREPDTPHLYRGHITAQISVYDTAYPLSEPVYTKEIETVYPPASAGSWGTGDREIRRSTMEAFAQDVAAKFYDRLVKVK